MIEQNYQNIKRAKELLKDGKIKEAIWESKGWASNKDYTTEEYPCRTFNRNIEDFFCDESFGRLITKEQKKLLKKFSHSTHFKEGVTKAKAVEYYFLCLDGYFNPDTNKYLGLKGGGVNFTTPMKNYWNALTKVEKEIKEGFIDISQLKNAIIYKKVVFFKQ